MGELAELSDEDLKSSMEVFDDSDAEMSQDLPEQAPSSPELWCIGCDISSKTECPVQKMKRRKGINEDTNTQVAWGKTSTRRVWTGRKSRRKLVKKLKKCGEWCNLCVVVSKKFLKKQRYKRLMTGHKGKNKNGAKKLLKTDLRKDSDLKQRFKRANKEAAHLRAGGQSRISHVTLGHVKESVKEKES